MSAINGNKLGTEKVLKSLIEECTKHPEKRANFIEEGSVDVLLGLCNGRDVKVGAYAAAALRVLTHGNNSVKAKIVSHKKGLEGLLALCCPQNGVQDAEGESTSRYRLLAHEQAAAVLRQLAFENSAIQSELVGAGVIKYLVKLCDVFDVKGNHKACCKATWQYSSEASKTLHNLVHNRKLVGRVRQVSEKSAKKTVDKLLRSGVHPGLMDVTGVFCMELYDTTTDKDILISDELISQQLGWPDFSDKPVETGKYVKLKSKSDDFVWVDVTVTEVIDGGHFWAHVGGEHVQKRIEEINKTLQMQKLQLISTLPLPGMLVCACESIGGHKDSYRARVLEASLAGQDIQVKVFAVDYGFTTVVHSSQLQVLPQGVSDFASQAVLCRLSGIQPPPKETEVLENAAGALRNLTQEGNSYRLFVAAPGGLEALIKLCTIPVKAVCVQAAGALLNLALNFKTRARIGYLGGIKNLLHLCVKYIDDDDVLLLAVGALQNLMVDSVVNRGRAVNNQALFILTNVYFRTDNAAVKARTLSALKNLAGNAFSVKGDACSRVQNTSTKPPLDARSIIDESTVSRFSLSAVSDDEMYTSRRRGRSKRSRWRSKPGDKPTRVAMSLESLRKSSNDESEGGNGTSYDDTDGDTDGESLVQDRGVPVLNTDNTDVDGQKFYIIGFHLPLKEPELHTFRPSSHVQNVSNKIVASSICAFLNSGKCGTVHIGVNSDGGVAGIKINRKLRDLLRLGVDSLMDDFRPPIKHDMYQVDFVPVVKAVGHEQAGTRRAIPNQYVVEVSILKCTGLIYTTPQGKCYFRQKSRDEEFTTQEIRDKTIQEQETIYNKEMQSLRKQLETMKRQLETKSASGADSCETNTRDRWNGSDAKRIELTLKGDGGLTQLGKFELKGGSQQCRIS